MVRRSLPLAVALAAVLAAVALSVDPTGLGSPPPTDAEPMSVAEPERSATPLPALPTTPPTTVPDRCDAGPGLPPDRVAPVPPELAARMAPAVEALAAAGDRASVSVWVQGIGEVANRDAGQPLLPGSNQKLLTAAGALALLPADHRLTTTVVATGNREGSTLAGNLVLVAGGDPTLTRTGPHSLAELARQVATSGLTRITGDLVVDTSRHVATPRAPGWQDWQLGAYVGPLSALTVDDNRHRADPAFLGEPAPVNGGLFASELAAAGVTVQGAVRTGRTPPRTAPVARVASPVVRALVRDMSLASDNEIAEALVREIAAERHGRGSTVLGTAAVERWLHDQCLATTGTAADGSGLSRANARSAGELRRVLQLAARQPWGDELRSGLPVSGVSGTLAGRLAGPATAGRVQAKTGTILEGAALSGYATTLGGREVTFSVIVNGPAPGAIAGAIDAVVSAVVGWDG